MLQKLSVLKVPCRCDKELEQARIRMLLRDHPLLNHRGVPSWPPSWTWISGLDNDHPVGEIGILRDVQLPNIEPADRCFLYIDFDGVSYIGCLLISFADKSGNCCWLTATSRLRTLAAWTFPLLCKVLGYGFNGYTRSAKASL